MINTEPQTIRAVEASLLPPAGSFTILFFPSGGEWQLIIRIKPLFEVLSSKVLEDINQGEQAVSHICSEFKVDLAAPST